MIIIVSLVAIVMFEIVAVKNYYELYNEIKTSQTNIAIIYSTSEKEESKTVSEMIKERCKKHEIDYRTAIAIARLESGNFTSEAYIEYNNVGGLSVNEVPIKYKTLEEGVNNFVDNLADNYYAKEYRTVEEISEKYCPINHKEWAYVVNKIKEER